MLDELPPFDYLDAATLAEAMAALTEHGPRAQVLAGGTDLLGLMKDRISGPGMPVPEVLVNVKRIPELHGIAEAADGGLRIGAAVTLADLERDARVTARFPALAQAAAAVATTQIRAMGTVGGNLCQRPWCWYFRHPQFPCLKRGGTQCFALPGSNRTYFGVLGLGVCVMSHPSDLAPALIALDARVAIAGPAGARIVPIEQFFRGPRSRTETVLEPGEILVAVDVPAPAPGARSLFLKHRLRGTWDFALSEVAVSATPGSRRAGRTCAWLSAASRPSPSAPPRPRRSWPARRPASRSCARPRRPRSPARRPLTQNGYKIDLTRALVARALSALAADLG